MGEYAIIKRMHNYLHNNGWNTYRQNILSRLAHLCITIFQTGEDLNGKRTKIGQLQMKQQPVNPKV
jgi:hypothetical protein